MPQEDFINGVEREKHEWLTQVGLLVREFVSSHMEEMSSPNFDPACQAHALCSEAMLELLGVRARVFMSMDMMPKHFYCATKDQVVLDAFPEGTMATYTGNEVNVCDANESHLGRHYPLHLELGDDGSIFMQRETYQTLIDSIARTLKKDPPDLEELKGTSPYKQIA